MVANETGHSASVLLNNGNGTFAATVNYPAGPTPRAVALGDLDADGDIDVAIADSSLNAALNILLNGGNGTFGAPIPFGANKNAWRIDLADIDADGDLDAVQAGGPGGVLIWANSGAASFTLAATHTVSASTDVDLADVDGDGDLDLAATGRNSVVPTKLYLPVPQQRPGRVHPGTDVYRSGKRLLHRLCRPRRRQ